jgi:hypothetical protein
VVVRETEQMHVVKTSNARVMVKTSNARGTDFKSISK